MEIANNGIGEDTEDENMKSSIFTFCAKITIAHFLTYFVLGLIFYATGTNILAYYESHPLQLATDLHKSTESTWVMAGPLFQIIRGILFGIVLLPFRSVLCEKRFGWLALWGLVLVFAVIAPAGEAPGSIEGVVYTRLPWLFHVLYLPEIIIQTFAFSWLAIYWVNHKTKKLTIPLLVTFVLIVTMNLMGVIQALAK